jgi:hypothetical protein
MYVLMYRCHKLLAVVPYGSEISRELKEGIYL